jgi:hypothetical protein
VPVAHPLAPLTLVRAAVHELKSAPAEKRKERRNSREEKGEEELQRRKCRGGITEEEM